MYHLSLLVRLAAFSAMLFVPFFRCLAEDTANIHEYLQQAEKSLAEGNHGRALRKIIDSGLLVQKEYVEKLAALMPAKMGDLNLLGQAPWRGGLFQTQLHLNYGKEGDRRWVFITLHSNQDPGFSTNGPCDGEDNLPPHMPVKIESVKLSSGRPAYIQTWEGSNYGRPTTGIDLVVCLKYGTTVQIRAGEPYTREQILQYSKAFNFDKIEAITKEFGEFPSRPSSSGELAKGE